METSEDKKEQRLIANGYESAYENVLEEIELELKQLGKKSNIHNIKDAVKNRLDSVRNIKEDIKQEEKRLEKYPKVNEGIKKKGGLNKGPKGDPPPPPESMGMDK